MEPPAFDMVTRMSTVVGSEGLPDNTPVVEIANPTGICPETTVQVIGWSPVTKNPKHTLLLIARRTTIVPIDAPGFTGVGGVTSGGSTVIVNEPGTD